MLPAELMPVFDGVFPATIITGSRDLVPNIANLSKVWHVDEEHVAIANQLLNKTASNLQDNPLALIRLMTPDDLVHWELEVTYVSSVSEGPLFESIDQSIKALSWVTGAESAAALRAAVLFRVLSVRRCDEESHHPQPDPETYGDLLHVLAETVELNRSSCWIPGADDREPQLVASRGVPGAGTDDSAFEAMKRLAALVASERRMIRLRNIRSQMNYMHTIRKAADTSLQGDSPNVIRPPILQPDSYLAFPIAANDSLQGIVCCEQANPAGGESFDRLEERFLTLLSRRIGETLSSLASVSDNDRRHLFRQAVERAKLEWAKETDPFYTVLSARERQVSIHVARGCTNAETAKLLFVSVRTVTTHLERIYQKLELTSRAALTRYIVEKGLMSDDPNP
ncbi:GAF domain-containing protein [Paenibacillus mesophilus]|uniref:LuxR C-terminal-related transcriptional regulator n=1 Tax=Paenibacillus mesophilus TaxID=2582849 RepID=UPI00110EDDA7|nr:LuxR C-terminal-related transcriptional regulator [Paenibacillus mesophilus]TMV48975.1 GAF domain-containing protein [Paenibacillus mesophilus]